jgi:hypothetical protein
MAATLANQRIKGNVPYVIEECYYTTLVAGATVIHAHVGPDGVAPSRVEMIPVVRPTSRDPVFMTWVEDDNDLTNDYIYLQFDTIPGGDLTGCEVKIIITWIAQASGGLT